MNGERHKQRRRIITAGLCFSLALGLDLGLLPGNALDPAFLAGCTPHRYPSISIDDAIGKGSAYGIELRASDDSHELVLGDRFLVAWMVAGQGGEWILHRGAGALSYVDPAGQYLKLSMLSGGHRVPLATIVGITPNRDPRRNETRVRGALIGGGAVVGSIAAGLFLEGADDFAPLIAICTAPVTIPVGAALGQMTAATFFEGRPHVPFYEIGDGAYSISVVKP